MSAARKLHLSALAPRDIVPVGIYATSIAGMASLLPGLPPVVRGLLLATFLLVAPGSAVLVWARQLSVATAAALCPAVGLALLVMVTAAQAMTAFWQPQLTVVVMAALSCASVGAAGLRARAAVVA